MTQIVAVASQKGGVGKTTTAVNLAYGLSLAGHRTALVDLDPQANATSGVGGTAASRAPIELLSENADAWSQILQPTRFEGLWLVASRVNHDYSPVAAQLDPVRIAELRDSLLGHNPAMDYAILDCPPAAGPIPLLALQLADSVLIPVQCEYYAMEGLSQMLPSIEKVRAARTRPLNLQGILLTMFDPALELALEVSQEVRAYFPNETLPGAVPRDVALAESSSYGTPVFEYDPRSRGSWSYLQLTKDLLNGR